MIPTDSIPIETLVVFLYKVRENLKRWVTQYFQTNSRIFNALEKHQLGGKKLKKLKPALFHLILPWSELLLGVVDLIL